LKGVHELSLRKHRASGTNKSRVQVQTKGLKVLDVRQGVKTLGKLLMELEEEAALIAILEKENISDSTNPEAATESAVNHFTF
jgi:hypothetical protein